ncbi:TPA: hypothetical protein DIV55_06540 [Patescibacteria group bacterium]|nr:hypothetical protein [Patescibacteria group bacterium]
MLPFDERLIPNIFSFNYPKSKWVRFILAIEMGCAILAVIGTLLLVLLPKTASSPESVTATSSATR